MSDKELAAINAAAVTREYRVQPHLGEEPWCRRGGCALNYSATDYRTVSAINGCVIFPLMQRFYLTSIFSPLVVLDNVKVCADAALWTRNPH
jgi:hypothetical protein